jgi:hypothetical protein
MRAEPLVCVDYCYPVLFCNLVDSPQQVAVCPNVDVVEVSVLLGNVFGVADLDD